MQSAIKNFLKSIKILLVLPIIFSTLCFPMENGENYYIKIPRFSSPPKIDGKLENNLWENAAILTSFTQYEPQEGASPSEKTEAYFGYDRKNLYIAVRCFDSNPKAIRSNLTERDKVYGDDEITIYLDTFNDKKRAFTFQVNPCGVQTDGIYTESQRRGRGRGGGGGGGGGGGFDRIDKNWDTFFTTDAHIDEKGYTVELAIPFKSLRFPNKKTQTWGLQVMRRIRRKNEQMYWHPRSRDINGFLIQSGTLVILGDIEKGKNFEVMPVMTGMQESGEKFNPEAGLNLKYGLTSDLTADLTFNPDFSQIEADMPQIDVNQRYTLYYPEKRPFFLEGKDLFDTPLELVYTRKIVNPQWGTKLTGKKGKNTLAFLSAYDENPTDIEIDSSTNSDTEEEISQRGLVNILRLKRDLYPESHIGLIFTDKEQGYSGDSITSNFNRVVGIDGYFKLLNYYRLCFQVLGSQTKTGDEKTSFVPAMKFNFSRRARHLTFSADYTSLPPDFESSTGFFRRKDIQSLSTRIGYAFLPQNDIIVDIRPSLEYKRIYDFNNTLTDEQFQFGGFISGWRGSFLYASFTSSMERYEGINFQKKSFRASINSDPLSWFNGNISYSFGDSIYYEENPYLGYKRSVGFRMTFKPLSNLRLFYNYKNDNFSMSKGGENVYVINLISQHISYQISRTLSVRLITDYNDYYKKLYNSILLSYVYRPGTVFYIGMDDNQEKDDSGIFSIQGRYYFMKFSYWWRR